MSMFAETALYPDGLIVWLAGGLIAGWFVGLVMKNSDYGMSADINLGLVGAVIGACLFGLIVAGAEPYWGSVAAAFVAACISTVIVRLAVPARSRL